MEDKTKLFEQHLKNKDYLNMSLLIHGGYDPNTKQFNPHLYTAFTMNDWELIEFLIENGCTFDSLDSAGRSVFVRLLPTLDMPTMEFCLKRGLVLDSLTYDDKKRTMLSLAAQSARVDVFEYILNQSNGLDHQDILGWTALHHAVVMNNLAKVRLLVERGANMNTQAMTGYTPLHSAIDKRLTEISTYLVENGADVRLATHDSGYTPVMLAAKVGSYGVLGPLVKARANINQHAKRKGFNSLMIASKNRHLSFVEALINCKVKLDETNKEGNTALYQAVNQDDVKIVEMLLKAGANPYLKNKKGLNCFDSAHRANRTKCMEVLKKYAQGTLGA